MNDKFSLLLADDESDFISMLRRVLRKEPYNIFTAENGEEALRIIHEQKIDASVIDINMPKLDGLALLKIIKKEHPDITVLMLTGYGEVKDAVSAMKLGASNFLEKPITPEHFLAHIREIEEMWKLSRENMKLKEQIDFTFGFDTLIGNSRPMLFLKRMITQVGPTDSTVLIQGETGTGKELVAKAIHKYSNRISGPFVAIDSASISESVLESELFGHVKGAFTGAHTSSPGLIRSAEKGTAFFDEIGELPLQVQAKLLRTLQEREVRPVGSTKTFNADVRIIAATNRDLQQEVQDGNFREDLYYRLNVIILEVPPLSDRKDDIPLLARHFLKQFAVGGQKYRIDSEAIDILVSRSWPGNVRQLENTLRRAIIFAEENTVTAADIENYSSNNSRDISDSGAGGYIDSDTLSAYEKAAVINALKKTDGNRKEAALLLDIGEATLYRKIKTYGL